MFTFEIKINGSLIGHVYGRNIRDNDGYSTYSYEYYEVEARKVTKGTVVHHRDEGIRKLINRILSDVDGQETPPKPNKKLVKFPLPPKPSEYVPKTTQVCG